MSAKVIISSSTGKREDISRESAYVQIRMFDDRIEIQNPGSLYGNNRIEKLGLDEIVEGRNKTIIRILEEKGDILENRHTGIATMRREMNKMNLPNPIFEDKRGDFKVIFKKENSNKKEENYPDKNGNYPDNNKNYPDTDKILEFCNEAKSAREIANHFGYVSYKFFRTKYIVPLINNNKLKMTIPDKIYSKNQKYLTLD